jgi:glucokinase
MGHKGRKNWGIVYMLYLGVDLGGTNIKVALVDEGGTILAEASNPTALPRSAEAVCDDIVRTIQQTMEKSGRDRREVGGIGVGCPGMVDDATGVVLYANNLEWHDFAMRDYLAQKTSLPVAIGNDANVAALGESIVGCGKGAQSVVIVTLGTGVGGGVVLDGKLYTGYTGAASELGHMVIVPEGELCTCGRRGCLEAYASATGLIRMTKEAMTEHPESALFAIAHKEGGVTGRTAFDAMQAGDLAGKMVVQSYIHYLGIGVINIINIFFPEVIGFSGGVANQGENLLVPLRREVEPQVFGQAYAKKRTRLVTCTLGYRSGVIGAAMLAKQELN